MRRVLCWAFVLQWITIPYLWAATPVILVNSSTGSDTAASGAGPTTAISGSTGRTRNTASQTHLGLFGATDDFSTVAVDGSHTCYIAIATAGARNHSSITAIKNTRQTGSDAAITSGTAILVVGSTTGWTAGDVIKVATAGVASADLYSTILTVDSGIQATLNDTAGTTCAACAWENPKQPTFTTGQGLNTGATNTAWAIGGKRASIAGTNSKKLFDNNGASGDAMPGWVVEMQSGHAETIAAAFDVRRSGDTTSSSIVLQGTAGAGTIPIITFSNNGNAFISRAAYVKFLDFEIQNTNATKTASIAIQAADPGPLTIRRIKVSHATNKFWKAFILNARANAIENDVANCANHGIEIVTGTSDQKIIANSVYSCGGNGIQLPGDTQEVKIYNNILNSNTGDGINAVMTTDGGSRNVDIIGNTFANNSGDGMEITGASGMSLAGMAILNNIFANNGGYGLNFSSGSATLIFLQATQMLLAGNNFFANTSGKYNPSTINFSELETTANPAFTNSGARNLSIGTALKAAGFPDATRNIGGSTTKSFVDPGAAQRQESGSACSNFFPFMTNDDPANEYEGDDLPWLRGRAS